MVRELLSRGGWGRGGTEAPAQQQRRLLAKACRHKAPEDDARERRVAEPAALAEGPRTPILFSFMQAFDGWWFFPPPSTRGGSYYGHQRQLGGGQPGLSRFSFWVSSRVLSCTP